MFGEDARIASKILQIALTSRDKSKEEPMPMCGIPHFASETYITKLIKAGHKVAICEQMEDAREAKGPERNNPEGCCKGDNTGYACAGTPEGKQLHPQFFPDGKKHGIAAADISTGEFVIYETTEPVEDEISRFEPREIVCPKTLKENIHYSEILKIFTRLLMKTGHSIMQRHTGLF